MAGMGPGSGEKRAEIHTYEAPWQIFAMNWSVRDLIWKNALPPFVGASPKVLLCPSNVRFIDGCHEFNVRRRQYVPIAGEKRQKVQAGAGELRRGV